VQDRKLLAAALGSAPLNNGADTLESLALRLEK